MQDDHSIRGRIPKPGVDFLKCLFPADERQVAERGNITAKSRGKRSFGRSFIR